MTRRFFDPALFGSVRNHRSFSSISEQLQDSIRKSERTIWDLHSCNYQGKAEAA
jgi:hypothetical protein